MKTMPGYPLINSNLLQMQAGNSAPGPAPREALTITAGGNPYLAYSTALVSRITVTLIWPG